MYEDILCLFIMTFWGAEGGTFLSRKHLIYKRKVYRIEYLTLMSTKTQKQLYN